MNLIEESRKMKIEIDSKKLFINSGNNKEEIHPFWLRERINNEDALDKGNQQRLFDPNSINTNIDIEKIENEDGLLNLFFNDGTNYKIKEDQILNEYKSQNLDPISIDKIKWDSNFNNFQKFKFENDIFEKKIMYDLLVSFYKYGFVVLTNVPTEDNFIIKFANSIGSVRRTNFGEFFNVRSVPNPNDLAYTSLALSPHTDNPYRKPVPCVQLLHCITNNVSGGNSTLVDGYTVSEKIKEDYPEYYEILSSVKVKFKFIDNTVVLEDMSELIKLDEKNNFKQVRFSPRLDYAPILEKSKLDLFYKARNKISELYNSDKYKVEFKLETGDLLMMDNHRLLHGRTKYDVNEGDRYLQGCYIDFDSTEGKLRHLKRKFNL